MKCLVSTFFLILSVYTAAGQNGNEWIKYQQPYFKIPVAKDGIYKVTQAALRQAGLPLSADPKTFQLFHRGIEQGILVVGENDGVFNTTDYIEFYGRANDGTLDASLYEIGDHQPHKYYNLYTDTTAYFLTFGGTASGKRITSYSGDSGGLAEETHHVAEKLLVLKESYSPGMDYGSIQKTTFDAGEGWTGLQILQGQERSYTIEQISETSPVSGKPILEVLLTGRGPMLHDVELYAGSRFLAAVSFPAYESFIHVQEIEWTDIDATGKLVIRIRVPGASGADRVSAGYIRLQFPQTFNLMGASRNLFFLNPNPSDVSLLKILNPSAGLRLFDVTDPASVLQIASQLTTTLDAVVPSTSMQRKILATSESIPVAGIRKVTFREVNPAGHNYVFITHRLLRKPAMGYIDPVKAFAEYRALPEGGGFDTLVMNIDQLYDQFNYGEASPRAVYQFMKYFASVKLPDYLFLVGKGLDVNYGYWRNPSAFTVYKDLVPSAGYPASDMAYTIGLGSNENVHAVATGRLTANSPGDVASYLNKVKEREALPFNDLTRKKMLHLSGGIEEHEPALFRNIMAGFESVAEDLYLGGNVQAMAKQSTDIKLINIADEVNNGLGLITFFGHSAPTTLDFDIGLVTDPIMGYNNAGKYPFLLMNGCDAGSFFLNTTIMGENWIQTPDKGAIGFIAHSSFGLVQGLQRYSSIFYDVAFGDSVFIKQGIGKVQQEVSRRYVENFGNSAFALSQSQQMVLLGDPAVRIFGAEKPDYSPDESKIAISSFDGEAITALTDSFQIRIPVRNFGIAKDERLRIQVIREFDGGQTIQYDTIIQGVLFMDTIAMVIRNTDRNGYGINTFNIQVDADDLVDELSEMNNSATVEYFIPLNSTRNLFPYNYSIVNTPRVDLSFQYTDLLAGPREYLLEIDTASTFDSGFKKQFVITAQVLGRKPFDLLMVDSVVYYWRTKISQPLENESKAWTASSFTFINEGPEGWAQMQFPQFGSNGTKGLVKDAALKRIKFQENISDLAIRTFTSASGKPRDSVSFKINQVEFNLIYEGGVCRNNTFNMIAFDRRSTQPYAGLYFKWYEPGGRKLLCGREPYVINSFTPQELITGNQDDLAQYADNIAEGDSVVFFNIGDAGFEQWPEAARAKLADFGISAAQIAGFRNGDAVVILGRKGSPPGTAHIHHVSAPETVLEINKTIEGRFASGSMGSTLIGPAQQWDRFIPHVKEVEGVDGFSFTIMGVTAEGREDTLQTNIQSRVDLSAVKAADYPHLRILFKTSDDINLTAVQLSKWLVLFEPVAEGLIYYKGPGTQETVAEGQVVSRDFGFINISNRAFSDDSLTVRYNLLNHSNPGVIAPTLKISPPAPGDTLLFTIPFQTLSKGGLNDMEVFVNPRIAREKIYDNNIMVLPEHLNVLTDQASPVVEVTFDGRFIRHDEYVSSSPSILIKLWDENAFMIKKDTLGMRIFIAYPCETDVCEFQPVYFSREDVTWVPASDTSDFEVHFSPQGLLNGRYKLRVESRDASGNTSGEIPYEIAFRVEHERSIAVTPAYPNPFFLEANLDVEVTGDSSNPLFYKLMITSLNGMPVAEIFNDAIGLHVGKNSIRWDGSNDSGQQLPNGLYLYRLIISGMDKDRFFYGKVVLMR